VWGAGSLGFGIVLTVIAAMTKDLRWLLILAWSCFGLTTWAIIREFFNRRFVKLLTIIVIALIGIFLRPPRISPTETPIESKKPDDKEPEMHDHKVPENPNPHPESKPSKPSVKPRNEQEEPPKDDADLEATFMIPKNLSISAQNTSQVIAWDLKYEVSLWNLEEEKNKNSDTNLSQNGVSEVPSKSILLIIYVLSIKLDKRTENVIQRAVTNWRKERRM
jgi:hypothetical protein